MKRYEWDAAYADIMVNYGVCDKADAIEFAAAATDEFNEGMTPQDAVDSEMSYWAEG